MRIPEAFYWILLFVGFLLALWLGLAVHRLIHWLKVRYWDWQLKKAWRDAVCYGTGVTRNGKHIPYRELFKP